MSDKSAAKKAKRGFTLERTYESPLDDVWDLWTTKEGVESWWGPEGFSTKVRKLELRRGGEMAYAMTATAAPQVDFMKKNGMSLTTEATITYDQVAPKTRLEYTNLVDFVPDAAPYTIGTTVELHAGPKGIRMVVTVDAMHDDVWTQRAKMGWESQLEKLARVLEN